MSLIACHTNLDSAEGGLAAIAADALGLEDTIPIRRSPAGWYKLVGFVPPGAAETVAAAVFQAGAGIIGEYGDCAFSSEGTGWFNPGSGAHPTIGQTSMPERAPEVRWETVVPRGRVPAVVTAYLSAHPYEEPAFDLYPVEDVLTRTGLGRRGTLPEPTTVAELAKRTASLFELGYCSWSGDGSRIVRRAGVLPGSGRSLLPEAAGLDALITGDVTYHDAERAEELGIGLICVPHGDLEWWCLQRWFGTLCAELAGSGVKLGTSEAWSPPWNSISVESGIAGDGRAEGRNVSESRPRDGGELGRPARVCGWSTGAAG
jgi:hypothetical protein